VARPSDEMQKVARDWMLRATRRLNGAAAAVAREDITEGEFDNHFDGVVSAIFHITDAVELVRTGIHRKVGEGEEATVIRSVIATLTADEVASVPAPARLIDLNARRNTSVHGHWTEVLDRDALQDAIAAGRQFHGAAASYIERRGVPLREG
jgi:hypothetical protein